MNEVQILIAMVCSVIAAFMSICNYVILCCISEDARKARDTIQSFREDYNYDTLHSSEEECRR